MDHNLERKYFLERVVDFCAALEKPASDVHVAEDARVLFRVTGGT